MDPTRQSLNLFITYVDKEGPFLKVWGQAEKNNSVYVEQFLLGASQQFEQGIGKIPFQTLQVGTLVCAKYKDNKYYRARIVSIDYLNQCFVEVNFLDYGNKDIVPSENIRSLQNFPTSFISIPPLATGFIFAEAHCPGGGEWKDEIYEIISKELRYREVQCHLLTQATQYYLIKLYIENTDIGALFISRGLMQPIPLHAQQAVLLSMSMQRKPPAVPAAQPTHPTEINTYKACTLEPMQQYAVYVSFVNEGPTHFSVQLQQSEHMLAKLMKEINEVNLRMMEDVPLPGTICLARCQEDGNVCRAVVTNEVDNQFKVFYVDFGNYETLPLEGLYQIPFKYVLPKVMAIRLALNGVEKSTVTIEMLLAFKKFVDNRLLYMKVLPSAKKTAITRCELWDPETKTSALDVINRAAQHAYPEPLLLNRGFTQPVKVSYVFSCNRFYVQLSSKEQELSKLMEDLQISCQSNDAIYDIKIGLPCCALFEADGLWYRSEIVDVVDKENVKVRYIDYGNEEVVPIIHLRMVEGEMLTVLRPQAIECCLNGYQNMGADETRDALLEDLILEQSFTMKVSEMLGKKALVELIDPSNYNIASLLLDKIASSKSQVSPMLVQAGNTLEHRKSSDSSDNYRPQRKPARDYGRNERTDSRNSDKSNESRPWRNDNKDTRTNLSWRIKKYKMTQNDINSNDASPDRGSWRQNNKGFNRNDKNDRDRDRGDRNPRGEGSSINDRFNKNTNYRGNDNKNNNWNNKENGFQKSPSYSSPVNEAVPPADGGWGDSTSSPVKNSYENRQPRDDKFGGRKKFDDRGDRENRGDRGGWNNKDGDRENRGDRGGWNNRDGFKKDGFKKDFRKDGSEMSSSGSEKSFRKGPRTSSRNDHGGGKRFQNRPNDSFGNTAGDSWSVSDVSNPIDAAPSTATFDQLEVVGSEAAVVISWFHNPGHFYCQLQSGQPEFKTLMEEIQQFYKNRKPETCLLGAPVVGLFPEDNVLYRAQVLEAVGGQYKVFYVDFGNVSTITKVWPIDNKFIQMPAQAVCCGLGGIGPTDDSWPDPSKFTDIFGKEFFMARFVEKDENRTYLQLWDNQDEVSQCLVQANLAIPIVPQSDGGIEIGLLLNQQFRVILKSVNNLKDIIVALECGLAITCKAHNLEMASESYEDVLKGYLEQTLIIYVDNILEDDLLDVTFYDNEGNKLVILTPDEGALDNVEPLCPILVIRSQIYGYVCHANETSIFLQPSVYADQIAVLLEQLFETYENVTEEATIIPEEGFVYAVHSADGNWYRGRVESFDDDKATVSYIDYGNSDSVAFSELRELKSEFNVPNIMCLQVTVTSGTASSFLEKDVLASIYYGETGWEGAIEEGAIEECAQSAQVEELAETLAEAVIVANNEPESDHQDETLVQEPTQPQESGEVLVQKHTEEILGTDQVSAVVETPQIGTPIYVSHVDSPTQFYVQFAESATALNDLQQNLQDTAEEMPVLENISVGVLCAAPYSVDHQWYRAEVLDADEDITTVRFVDYGNTDVINNKTTQVKTLPSNLLTLAVYAARCSLKLKAMDDEWSEQALELFEALVQQGNMAAEFIIQDEKTNIVELYSDGKNVKDALLAQNLAIPCEIDTESKTTCFVSHLNSPSEFWVQMDNCVNELEWIAEQLSGAEQFPELEDMTPGTLCGALFPDDEMWYRARILSNTIAGIELLFVDYGNSCVSSSLRQLPEDLVVTPPLAQKCCLQRPEGIPYWTKEAQDKFAEISAEGQTIFEMKKISTGETATVELLLNSENIVLMILPATVNGVLKNFETLDKFNVEKDGEPLGENVCLEPMPGMEWDEEANKKFLELYANDTVFQVELIGEDCVRLYQNGADIRPELGGVKSSLNLSNTQEEKTDNLVISEDHVSDCIAGGNNLDTEHSIKDTSPDDSGTSQDGTEATDTTATSVCDRKEQDSGHIDSSTEQAKDKDSTQDSETVFKHDLEHDILKENDETVQEADEKIKDAGAEEQDSGHINSSTEQAKDKDSTQDSETVFKDDLEHDVLKENEETVQEAVENIKEAGAKEQDSGHIDASTEQAKGKDSTQDSETVFKHDLEDDTLKENEETVQEADEKTKDAGAEVQDSGHIDSSTEQATDKDSTQDSETVFKDDLEHDILKENEETVQEAVEKIKEAGAKGQDSGHIDSSTEQAKDKNSTQDSETVFKLDLEHDILKENEETVQEADGKIKDASAKDQDSGHIDSSTEQAKLKHSTHDSETVFKHDLEHEILKENEETVQEADEKKKHDCAEKVGANVEISQEATTLTQKKVQPSLSQRSNTNSRASSNDRASISHDDKILPGSVSRPHSPLPSEHTEDTPISRPPSSQGRRISHDDKILPACLSRPHTPLLDDSDSN